MSFISSFKPIDPHEGTESARAPARDRSPSSVSSRLTRTRVLKGLRPQGGPRSIAVSSRLTRTRVLKGRLAAQPAERPGGFKPIDPHEGTESFSPYAMRAFLYGGMLPGGLPGREVAVETLQ